MTLGISCVLPPFLLALPVTSAAVSVNSSGWASNPPVLTAACLKHKPHISLSALYVLWVCAVGHTEEASWHSRTRAAWKAGRLPIPGATVKQRHEELAKTRFVLSVSGRESWQVSSPCCDQLSNVPGGALSSFYLILASSEFLLSGITSQINLLQPNSKSQTLFWGESSLSQKTYMAKLFA